MTKSELILKYRDDIFEVLKNLVDLYNSGLCNTDAFKKYLVKANKIIKIAEFDEFRPPLLTKKDGKRLFTDDFFADSSYLYDNDICNTSSDKSFLYATYRSPQKDINVPFDCSKNEPKSNKQDVTKNTKCDCKCTKSVEHNKTKSYGVKVNIKDLSCEPGVYADEKHITLDGDESCVRIVFDDTRREKDIRRKLKNLRDYATQMVIDRFKV